jgi:transposase
VSLLELRPNPKWENSHSDICERLATYGYRRARRANDRSDAFDAELAARSVLAGTAKAVPKSADGVVEKIRQIKMARDIATKRWISAIITHKTIVVNAPPEMREQLDHLTDKAQIERCVGFWPGKVTEAISSTKYTLRSLAKRWQFLDAEVKVHDRILDELIPRVSPTLREGLDIGPDTAAKLHIVLGDNLDRVRSEDCFAKLCGVAPIPTSSGMTNRHRLAWNGHRQANAAFYRVAMLRMQHHELTVTYVARRTDEGLSMRDIIRCLNRPIAREAFGRTMTDFRALAGVQDAAITHS